jgi:hypothetical protein
LIQKIDATGATDAPLHILYESVNQSTNNQSLVKCPEPECDYQTEPFLMKVHLEHEHGITKQLEIREPVRSEYQGSEGGRGRAIKMNVMGKIRTDRNNIKVSTKIE